MWREHFERLTSLKVRSIFTKKRELLFKECENVDVFIVNWDVLRLMPELLQWTWLHIIADECHRGQNRKAQQTRALKKIKGEFKTGLSGTPVTNHTDKLWSILNWLYPKKYKSYWQFYAKYVDYDIIYPEGYHKIKGVKNEEGLHEEIKEFYVRHLKLGNCCKHHPNGVQPFLPAKYYSEIVVELDPKQRRAYEDMKKTMVAWIGDHEDTPLVAPIIVARLVRQQQFSAAYAELVGNEVMLTEPSSKLDALMQLIEDNPDEQIVVFSQFKKLINLLAKRLEAKKVPFEKLTGDTVDRSGVVSRFQSGASRIFIGTIAAGGVGITLTAAQTVVFLDRNWSPALNMQAEDRLHRIGQKGAVQVIDIMASNTLDRGRAQTLANKWIEIKKLLGDT